MEFTKKYPLPLLLGVIGLVLVAAAGGTMIVLAFLKPAAAQPATQIMGNQAAVNLNVLDSPVLSQLSEYDANAVYPLPINAGDLSRDNPFAGY